MTLFETIEIDGMVAACSGATGGPVGDATGGGDGRGGGAEGMLGHPKVYLNLAPSGRVECPYCSRLFVNRALARGNEVAPGAAHG